MNTVTITNPLDMMLLDCELTHVMLIALAVLLLMGYVAVYWLGKAHAEKPRYERRADVRKVSS